MKSEPADAQIARLIAAQPHRKAVPIEVPRCCALLPMPAQRSRQCCAVARVLIDDKPYCFKHAQEKML